MRKIIVLIIGISFLILTGVSSAETTTKTIGIIIFDGVLTSEVTAPIEVFGSPENEEIRFNVLLIAENEDVIKSHEGLRLLPDVTFKNSPSPDVLIVPSSYNVEASEKNPAVINFIQQQSIKVDYLASNCAGAFILGEAGLLDGKKVVTYVGGGEELKKRFPKAIVQDDQKNTVIVDGNYISSNGALVSYKSSLKLLELISGKNIADKIKDNLYLERL